MPAKKGIGIWDSGPAKPKPRKAGGTRVSVGPIDIVGKRPTSKPAGKVGRPPQKRR